MDRAGRTIQIFERVVSSHFRLLRVFKRGPRKDTSSPLPKDYRLCRHVGHALFDLVRDAQHVSGSYKYLYVFRRSDHWPTRVKAGREIPS